MVSILILFCLIFLNGLFVMAEIALVSARKSKLEDMASKGDIKSKAALKLTENPELFLSTAQIGITLIAILTGYYTSEKFSGDLQPYIERISYLQRYAGKIASGLIVISVTFLSILFGELIPKRIGLLKAERIARIVARPMTVFSRVGYPIVALLNWLSNIFILLFSIKSSPEGNVTEDEIKAIINEGTEQGTIEEAEQEIIERVFHLGDRNITSLMTHRTDIVWFEINEELSSVKEKIKGFQHSVYPVCEQTIDDIKGIVYIKEMYLQPDAPLSALLRKALFVPENNSAY